MASRKLLRLKHNHVDMGFLTALLSEEEMGKQPHWTLRVESPASADEYRVHLDDGSSMSLSMITRDGKRLRGEAYVASISGGLDAATIVVLAGTGPLGQG